MDKFFQPKTIAVVGASSQEGKIGNILIKNISQARQVEIFPVNHKRRSIYGLKTYASVLDINEKIDLVVIAIPAKFVSEVVAQCGQCPQPIKNIVIISAGFSEIGKEGKKREKELLNLAQKYKLNILGPNCLGLVNTHHDLNASFAKRNVPKGSIGLIAQSGALTTSMFDLLKVHGLGFSLVATLGNKVDVNENCLLKYFAKDQNTKVIALYLEDISEGRELAEILKKISPRKPVVLLKAGVSEKAQKAIQSHTGAMAGDADVAEEAISSAGGIFCDNFPDFIGVIRFLCGFERPRNESIMIVTNAGGPGVVATDVVSKQKEVSLFEPSEKEKELLKEHLPEESSVENPVDVLGDAMEDRYRKIFKTCSAFEGIGTVCVLVTPQAQTPIGKISEEIEFANSAYDVPFVPIVIGGDAHNDANEYLGRNGHAPFVFPLNAIRSVAKCMEYRKNIKNIQIIKEKKTKTDKLVLKRLLAEGRNILYYSEARKIAIGAKLNVLNARELKTKNDVKRIRFGYPYVAKVDSPEFLHKNAKDAISLGIKDKKELKKEFKRLRKISKDGKIIIQKQQESGLELIIGIKKDPSFGHVLMLGIGGIFTEFLDVKSLWLLPVDRKDILRKIKNSVLSEILKKKKISVAVIAGEVEKVAGIVQKYPYIKELDVNPIMTYPKKNPVIVDIKIIVDIKSNY